jgi:hypothetical protein
MDIAAIIKQLHDTTYLSEMAHVTAFQGNRITEDGEEIPVRVAVLDYGPELPESRYMVVAEDDDGAVSTGEAASTVEEAIAGVPWTEFELDEFEDDEDGEEG